MTLQFFLVGIGVAITYFVICPVVSVLLGHWVEKKFMK